ncbi:MAG TPA: hypothetical protein VMR90_09800 [Candidatus Cybelea sp.]|nr:hypothetical protein [Candidatus Cybelea sp.]
MIGDLSVFRRGQLHFAAAAGLLSVALLLTAKPVRSANSAQEQVSRDFQQTVTLGAGQSVRIEHKFGGIRLHGESGRDVKISATIHAQASSHEQAESFAQKIKIEVQQTGEGVRIKTVYPDEEKSWFHSSKHSSWSVSYDIGMPADAPVTVRNSFGSIEVAGVHGVADVENGYGTLNVRDAGPGRWNNAFGSIEIIGAGGNVIVSNNNASVEVSDIKGTLEVRDRFGSITARNIQGAATLTGGNGAVTLSEAAAANITTSFGSVDARNIRGDLAVHDNNGNVEISAIGGAADITSSFGNVTFTDVHGRVNCTTNNGRVKGSSVTGNSVTIRDSFGNIEMDTIGGSLDAETSNGKISVRDARGSATLKSSFGAIEASNIPKGIRAVTGNGAITLTDIGGDAYAKTSFGSVLIERISGNLTVENTNGSVTARNVKGDADVKTSFAGVTLDTIGGRITVDNQNGAIAVVATRPASGCRDISLKTSFSSIRVRIPEGLGYNLTARTSFGRISSELPVTSTGSIGGDALNGTIGSGGCQLQLTDSNGSIEIAKGS